jgi:hypothetical protein
MGMQISQRAMPDAPDQFMAYGAVLPTCRGDLLGIPAVRLKPTYRPETEDIAAILLIAAGWKSVYGHEVSVRRPQARTVLEEGGVAVGLHPPNLPQVIQVKRRQIFQPVGLQAPQLRCPRIFPLRQQFRCKVVSALDVPLGAAGLVMHHHRDETHDGLSKNRRDQRQYGSNSVIPMTETHASTRTLKGQRGPQPSHKH